MGSIDNFRERFATLEQQTEQLKHQTHALQAHTRTVERRLRWWRGIACGLLMLGLISPPLQSGIAQDEQSTAGEYRGKQRLAALEYKLEHVSGGPNEVIITGANLRIVNGLGTTETTNGLGNLIVGYNELRRDDLSCPSTDPACSIDNRTGSHNVVVGKELNFSSFGGLVVGVLRAWGRPLTGRRLTARPRSWTAPPRSEKHHHWHGTVAQYRP